MSDKNMHRPAAAWSRDALSAWQYVCDKLVPAFKVESHEWTMHVAFLRRWAIKTLALVGEEMQFSDWYWFLCEHFNKELARIDKHHKPLDEFRPGGMLRETDPPVAAAKT